MASATAGLPYRGFAVRLTRLQPIVLVLLVMSAAMLLPMAHTALHGSELLSRNFVAGYASRGPMTPGLASAAREVSETRIDLQPVLGPFHALVLMLTMAAWAWLLCRWRTARISFGTALHAAAVSVAAGQLFYLVLYFAGWTLLGSSSMLPEWQRVVPTSLADVRTGPRAMRHILEGVTLGALVRFAALGVALRQLVPALPTHNEWIVVAGTAVLTFAAFVAGMLL